MRTFAKSFFAIIALVACVFSSAVIAEDILKVAKDGKVTAYMLGTSSSDYENLFTANFDGISSTEVPRPAFLSNLSEVGTSLDLGTHLAGRQLVLVTQVLNTGDWFYSLIKFNDDKKVHFRVHQIYMEDGTPALIVQFEDTYDLGDADYNDQVVLLVNAKVVRD